MRRCFSCFNEYDSLLKTCPFCGSTEIKRPKEPIHLIPGTVLAGRYIVGQAVGAGGFGVVYKAWDSKLETVVAVKEFFVSRLVTRAEGLKDLIVNKKAQEEFKYRKERFLAEARTMAKFGSHRSITNVFEFFEENNTAYIVMELMRGLPLNAYLHQNKGKIDIDFAVMIANEVGNALRSLHEKNVIHKDVAPDNIYLCSGKEIKVKLSDFGAAKLADASDDVIDVVLKPGYSPVEQYVPDNNKNIGPHSDIYALGATLYVMLTGIKPDESTNRAKKDELLPPNQINPLVSENLSNAVMKAMALERHLRFKNVSEFLQAINGEKKVVTLAKEKKRRKFRRFSGILAASLALVAGIAIAGNVYMQKQQEQLLKPANIEVWFAVAEGSNEEGAMQAVKQDFESKFEEVSVNMVAIPEDEYEDKLIAAAQEGTLPHLFESSGVDESVLESASNLDNVIKSEQFKSALFLNQYKSYYKTKKQIPLAVNVPIAYVVTNGATFVDYKERYFNSISDFGTDVNIAFDKDYESLLNSNFSEVGFCDKSEFLNNEENTSPVMLSSTMALNNVENTLTNYPKAYVYYDNDEICCEFIYEWSMGDGTKAEKAASERLLSWMLGNVYQNYLMISECSEGQIPLNAICFESKLEYDDWKPMKDIYQKFVFDRKG